VGCNCGGTTTAGKWYYRAADGKEYPYATEVEAKAAKIRAGGTGEVVRH
jgi:hypothetical protein